MAGLRVARTGGVHIGSDVFINFDCYIDAEASVVIEDRVQIADHVRLVTSGHDINTSQSRAGESWGKPIRIGAGSWICSSVTVLPGVTIGHGCVVAAGAVVVSDCEPNGLYMGVPAVRKRGFEGASLGSERTLRYEPPPKPWRHAL
ncbi:MAG TPA: acyltransferase [Candidatus Dormibacteraeota bacterium]